MKLNTFSIKTFLADVPRMINENFAKIAESLSKFYDEDTNSINATNVTATGRVVSNSITTNFLTVKIGGGEYVTMSDIVKRLEKLEEA